MALESESIGCQNQHILRSRGCDPYRSPISTRSFMSTSTLDCNLNAQQGWKLLSMPPAYIFWFIFIQRNLVPMIHETNQSLVGGKSRQSCFQRTLLTQTMMVMQAHPAGFQQNGNSGPSVHLYTKRNYVYSPIKDARQTCFGHKLV